jgi:CHAT domain-containing protein
LALLYRALRQYTEAEPLLHRVLAIWEHVFGSTHPTVALGLNNLAFVYRDLGRYAEAELLFRRALAIREQLLVPTHPDLAHSLHSLAELYHAQNRYAEAEPLYRRALAIREHALGPSHPDVAASLHSLAELSRVQGQYAEAVPLYRRVLAIQEQALGPLHPDVATSLHSLASLALSTGDPAHALPLLIRSSAIREHTLALMLTLGSEAQKLASAAMLRNETDMIVSLHTRVAPDDGQALRLALTTVLRRKGRVLEAMTDTLAALRRQVQPEVQKLLTQWATVRGHLATLVFTGLGTQSPEAYRSQLTQLDAQALEAQLSARSAAFRTQTQPVTLAQVRAAIPEGATLVELALYAPWTPPQQWGAPRYVAYVLPPQGEPAWVDLGEAAPIDHAVAQFRADLSGPHRLRVQASARALDDLVLRPMRPLLGPARHLLIVLDGMLHLVPFGALVDATGRYLLESVTVSYLTTGRDLLRPLSARPGAPPPLVVGHPDFDRPGVSAAAPGAASTPAARRAADLPGRHFPPLPSTAEEVVAVQGLLPGSQLWTGPAASEGVLKQVQGPRLLHIATHGFFLADQPTPPPSMQALPLGSPALPAALPGVPLEHPLLRAGLALAGANAPQPAQDDGLLTALEVASLDLGGTELVVLSACDTGVGQVRTSEGVYGLRRALVMAGAASQVMSLWKVDDEATRELMVAYYRRLQAGEGRAEALRQGQLAMLASPQYRHPFYWAAFLLSGAWTPLTAP